MKRNNNNSCISRSARKSLLLLISLLFFSSVSLANKVSDNFDIRILIDISGSMKENDPANLRASALRMLVHLLPEKSSAGVWTFGQYVNMLVKHEEITGKWKKNAIEASRKINSLGLFTDIGSALRKSTYDWNKEKKSRRILILLTDGYVDISKDKNKNIESKKYILEKELSKIRQAKGKIFTVALSANADHDFLKYLSTKTDGLYVRAESSGELNQAFLNIFENTVKTNSLPISNNSFKVDASITDMTLLLFHDVNSKKISLYSPDKSIYSHNSTGKNINWHRDTNYDLITVNKPTAGAWYITGDYNKNSKVLVVTNLKLGLNTLPNNLFPGDKLVISPFLEQQDKKVTDEKFNKLVSYNAELVRKIGSKSLASNISSENKIEFLVSEKNLVEGKNDLVITAKSPTFVREINHSVNVFRKLLGIQVIPDIEHGKAMIEVSPAQGLILNNISSFSIRKPKAMDVAINKTSDTKWSASVPTEFSDKIVQFHVAATLNDNKFNIYKTISIPVFIKQLPDPGNHKKQEKLSSPKPATENDKMASKKAMAKEKLPPKQEKSGINWITVVISVIGVNLIIVLFGYVILVIVRKRKHSVEDEIFSSKQEVSEPNLANTTPQDKVSEIEEFDSIEEFDTTEEIKSPDKSVSKLNEISNMPIDPDDEISPGEDTLNEKSKNGNEIPTITPEEVK